MSLSLVGVEDIVAGLAEDESVLLVLVIYGEEVLMLSRSALLYLSVSA